MFVWQLQEILSTSVIVDIYKRLKYVLMEKLTLIKGADSRLIAKSHNKMVDILEKHRIDNSLQSSLLSDGFRL
jgi:hypothetical protein